MAIDALRDGYVRICFDPSLNIVGDRCRVVLEGQYYDPGDGCDVVPDVLRKVTSLRDIDCLFGEGSVLAESFKTALECCAGGGVEFFALPRLDADGAVAAEYTVTFTGPATSDGRVEIYWGDGRYNVSFRVEAGDTETDIAAALVANMPAGFPYTAVAAAGVVTLTARNAGTVGNYLNPVYNWRNRNNFAPEGVTVAFAQTVVGATDPAPLDYSAVLGECCVCCYGMLYGDDAWQDGVIAYLNDAWACDKPQCFGHGYTYNAGTLGEILAQDTNDAVVSRMAHCDTDPNFPWLKIAAYASKSCCETVDNPEISIQGPQFGVLQCVTAPEACAQCFTFDEQEQLRESGFVVTVPLSGGQGALTSPMVTNDITNNRYDDEGRENLTFRDVSSRRLAAATAEAFANELQKFNGLGFYTKNTTIREGVRGTNPRLMTGAIRAWLKSQVGVLFSEFDDLDKDFQLLTDFEVQPKCLGVPGKVHINLVYRPPVRLNQVVVNMQPKLLDNC
ncbi:tail sheath protein [Synechococcus phage Ssp-JY38]|nr:tail sheath protein [Synechococcus phage Yong-L2-223]